MNQTCTKIIFVAAVLVLGYGCKQDDLGSQNAPAASSIGQALQNQGGFTTNGYGTASLPLPNGLNDPLTAAFTRLRISTLSDTPSANIAALFDPAAQASGLSDLGGFTPQQGVLAYDWQAIEKEGNVSLTIKAADKLDPDLKYAILAPVSSSAGAVRSQLVDSEVIEGFEFSDTITLTAPAFAGTIDYVSLSIRDMTTCYNRFGPQCTQNTPLEGDIIAVVSLNVSADTSRYVIQQYEDAQKREQFGNTLQVVRGITGILGGGGGLLGGLFGR